MNSPFEFFQQALSDLWSTIKPKRLNDSKKQTVITNQTHNRFLNKPYLTTYRAPVTSSDISFSIARYESNTTFKKVDEILPSKPRINSYHEFENRCSKLISPDPNAYKKKFKERLDENVKNYIANKHNSERLQIQTKRNELIEQVRRPVQIQYTTSIEAFQDAAELHRDREIIDRKEFYRKRPLPKLTSEHEKLIEEACRYHPMSQTLVDLQGVKITRKDIHTLMGLNWLNDEVINFYMTLIVERARCSSKLPKVYTFNTFFYSKLRSAGHSSLKRWTRKVDIFSYDLLTVPVHVGQNHWCLALIDFKHKKISYFDSLGGSPQECHATLADYLRDEFMDKKKQEFCLDGWDFYTAYDDIPQQKNGSDCGVFTCTYAEYLSREAELDFEQKDMPYFRKKMIVEIMLKRLLAQ